jgi:RNA polymerase sigma-70 factor (ECF subfamily)
MNREVSHHEAATLAAAVAPPSERSVVADHLERSLNELSTLQRSVVILRHLDGLSTKEVSEILHCSEGTVKTHLFRGLKKLRERLRFLKEDLD